jgi:hypothetical protein
MFLPLGDQVSHPYKTGRTTVLDILISIFLDSNFRKYSTPNGKVVPVF